MSSSTWSFFDSKDSSGELILINARVIDPKSGFDKLGYLVIKNGIIDDFGAGVLDISLVEESAPRVIDCKGLILMPGVVDIHVHLRDPGQEHKETIETGTKSAAKGGVTTVVCQPNTKPNINDVSVVSYVLNKKAYVKVECYASVTHCEKGSITDMSRLVDAGVCGFTDDGLPVENSSFMRQAFLYSKMLNVPIAQHAEDLSLSCGGAVNEGPISDKLAVSGANSMSEAIMVARDLLLLKISGGYYHLLHVSCQDAIDMIFKAKSEGLNVTCEVTPHHLLLNDSEVGLHNTSAKMNPPLRSEGDRCAMVKALRDGIIDCIASDHAPHEPASKDCSIEKAAFGIVGLETILPLSLELYHTGEISLMDVLGALTYKPAKIIRKDKIGVIEIGAHADLILLDLDYKWRINVNNFASKSKNSPFHDREVKGLVRCTMVNGQIVYDNGFLDTMI